jgi:CBS domain-containing protein
MTNKFIKDIKAEDVMSRVSVTAIESDSLSDVLAKLKRHDLQELPVIRKNRLVGLVSYDTLIKRRNLPLTTKVAHIMTKPPELSSETPLTTVAEMLISSGFRALPITSKGKKLVGIVTRDDLLSGIMKDRKLSRIKINELMTREPVCIQENDTINQARTVMKRLSVRTLPVVDDMNRIVGVIGVKDIARMWTPKTKESTGELRGEKISLDVEVKSVMNPNPVVMGSEGIVSEVIDLMRKNDISNVLVTEKQTSVGIITSLDLIELLASSQERESLYVQITGLEEEDAEVYDDMYELIQKSMHKINKMVPTRIFTVHVSQYHNKSFVKEYELRARLTTERRMFYARSKGWDLAKALDEALESLERMVTKEKEIRLDAIKKRNM